MNYPLNKMKILDFTTLLPGPYGSMILADLGADIIKIENYNNPDLMRFLPPLVNNVSAGYAHLNRGKRSLGIDLKKSGAKEIIYRLVKKYDIVLDQFRPGVMERLGIGYEKLREYNESLIYCSVTGYGQKGTYANRAGHDINYLSLAGINSYSGRKSSGPALNGIQIADIAGGSHNMVIAVLAAYIKRLDKGEGDYIDISMTDCAFSLTAFYTAGFLAGGSPPQRESEFLNGGSIYDYYRTLDGRFLSVGPVEEKFFGKFCEAIGLSEVSYKDLLAGENISEIKKKVTEIISSKTLDHWVSLFKDIDACVEPVLTIDEVTEKSPVAERDMIFSIRNEKGVMTKQISNPYKFRSGIYNSKFAGVTVGYHNDDILKGAGFGHAEIKKFQEEGIINK